MSGVMRLKNNIFSIPPKVYLVFHLLDEHFNNKYKYLKPAV